MTPELRAARQRLEKARNGLAVTNRLPQNTLDGKIQIDIERYAANSEFVAAERAYEALLETAVAAR